MATTQAPRERIHAGWLIAVAAVALIAALWIAWSQNGEGRLSGHLGATRPLLPSTPVNPPLPERPHLPTPIPGPR